MNDRKDIWFTLSSPTTVTAAAVHCPSPLRLVEERLLDLPDFLAELPDTVRQRKADAESNGNSPLLVDPIMKLME